MVKKSEIGSVHYSKILDRNITIKEGPSDDFYKIIGLQNVLEPSVKKSNDSDKKSAE